MIRCSFISWNSAAKKIFIEYYSDVETTADLSLCVLATVLNRFGVEAGAKSAVCFAANDVTKVESMSSSVIISTKDPQWFQINIAAHSYSTLV